jgi:hypothetical protein
MGNCGSLNVMQSAVVDGWTDRSLRHGFVIFSYFSTAPPSFSHISHASNVPHFLTNSPCRPVTCYCYAPCIYSVKVQEMAEIKMHYYALLEDTREPSNTKYIYGPTLFRLGTYYLHSPFHSNTINRKSIPTHC